MVRAITDDIIKPQLWSLSFCSQKRPPLFLCIHSIRRSVWNSLTTAWLCVRADADNNVCMIYLLPLTGCEGWIQLAWKYLMNGATSGARVCLAFSHFLKWTQAPRWLINEQRIDRRKAIFILKDGNLMGKCRSDWLIEQNNWAAVGAKWRKWRAVQMSWHFFFPSQMNGAQPEFDGKQRSG